MDLEIPKITVWRRPRNPVQMEQKLDILELIIKNPIDPTDSPLDKINLCGPVHRFAKKIKHDNLENDELRIERKGERIGVVAVTALINFMIMVKNVTKCCLFMSD